MNDRGGRVLATLIGAVGVVLWATETSLVTYTTAIPPLETVAIAFVFAAALSPLVWLVTGKSPLVAFRQPPVVWFLTVGSLVAYHACIYYATQRAPPAAAALLQGTTPLMIVIGSALLPGERLRWWHIAGVIMGLAGVTRLINTGDGAATDGAFYLALIGIAAALWGLYSILSRTLPEVPSSALGMFYAVSAILSFAAHFSLENWVQPTPTAWVALAALGIFPMGLAIYFWDFGLKRGDIQALGAFSYIEPFIGAVLVALIAGGALDLSLLWSGLLIVGGATFASASLWMATKTEPSIAKRPLPHARINIDLVDVDLISQFERPPMAVDLSSSDLRRCLGVLHECIHDLRKSFDTTATELANVNPYHGVTARS